MPVRITGVNGTEWAYVTTYVNEGGTAEDTMPFVPCFTARDEKAFFIPRKSF